MSNYALDSEDPTRSGPDREYVKVALAEIPDALLLPDTDAPEQAETLLHLNGPDDDDELSAAIMAFSSTKPITISLEDMKRNYDQKRAAHGMDLLKRRMKVDWRNSTMVSSQNVLGKKMHWSVNGHYMDMLVIVSRDIGLGALLPNSNSNISWMFHLDVSKNATRDFGIAHAKLGFDPSERMLWIGKTPMSEDVWIAMVPKTLEADGAPALEELEGTGKRSTRLRERHRKILHVFLATMLERIGKRGVYTYPAYPDLDDSDMFKESSNL